MKIAKKIFLLTFIAAELVDQPSPEVLIKDQGIVRGKLSKDGTFFEFTGIPYASTNAESRFQAPLPAPKWDGVFDAVEMGPSCPQDSIFGVYGEENCLNLNIYAPVKAQNPLPVMVFIHGGAFIMGSGGKPMYGPEFLVQHDVILVTINYRLGALGFLCLGIKEAPGNAGLKDQVAALRWIKKNIAAFGGDVDNITVFGESAGAVSTSYMIASPVTDGLFNRAIIQSGAATANWALNTYPLWTSTMLAEVMGFKSEDPQELYEFFNNASIVDLVTAKTKKPYNDFYDTELIHLPCVEKEFDGIERVVTDLPYNLIKNTKKNISIITGSNNREGLFLVAIETEENMSKRNEGYLYASDLKFESESQAKEVNRQVKEFYFGDNPISLNSSMIIDKLYTELYFEIPALLETNIYLENTNISVHNYRYSYSGHRNVVKYISGYRNEDGACHGDELFYLFDSRYWPFWISPEDRKLIGVLTKLWTNFAKYGDPTPDGNELDIKWLPSKMNDFNVLYIDKNLTMGPVPNEMSYNLWKSIYRKYRKNER